MEREAATYVQISKLELEDWLDSIGFRGKWRVKKGTVGIYVLPLSKTVAIELSSTIGSQADAMGRGRASMSLKLVSLITGRVLNKKAQGQSHFKRTTNWKDTWAKGIDRVKDAYTKSRDFYDAIASIEDREKYKNDLLAKINAIPGWENSPFLKDMAEKVEKGGILTPKQLAAIDKSKGDEFNSEPRGKKPYVPAPKVRGGEDDPYLDRIRKLWVAAKRARDNWLMEFAKSVGEQYKLKGTLSDRQKEVLENNFKKYRV